MKIQRPIILSLATLAAGLLSAQPSLTSQYTYLNIDHPDAIYTFPLGINDRRVVAGVYGDQAGVNHGFIWKDGVFTQTIDFPGAAQFPGGGTMAGGINNRGDVAGTYTGADGFQHGYKMTNPEGCEGDDNKQCKPVFTTIDVPGAAQTTGIFFDFGPGLGSAAFGISNSGLITGQYATNGLYSNAFILAGEKYTPIDSPSSSHFPGDGTKCFGVNSSGAAACDYATQSSADAPQFSRGFLYDNGQMTKIFVPGSDVGGFGTQVTGINDSKKIVGTFTTPAGPLAGLVWFRGDYFTLNYPAMPLTELHSINNRGEITGGYSTVPVGESVHGFLAIPK